MRPVSGPHRHDPRFGVSQGLNGRRPLGPQARVLPGKRLLPLHRGGVRPGQPAGPEPAGPVHFPVPPLLGPHFQGR
ncbi:unnamed protein product [Linum tenue]|uniref:Uncharacterized protein n=1 Tax=Linum tenue TaxID=586396 RepID=A0AAV0H2T2_9ROSI|nr:unnamed protein product [Linum tenue]